jgi:hypothetical protein
MNKSARALCSDDARSRFILSEVGESPYVMLDLHDVVLDFNLTEAPRPETLREEDEYFNALQKGTFQLPCSASESAPPHVNHFSHFYNAIAFERGRDAAAPFGGACSEVVETPTLLVTRYEYANLYHQLTDFINAEIALALIGRDALAHVRVEFFDGHQRSSLDDFWKRAFDNGEDLPTPASPATATDESGDASAASAASMLSELHTRFRHRGGASRVCFRRLILPSPGYVSRLFVNSDHADACRMPSALMARLRDRVLRSFDVDEDGALEKPGRCVAIVRRDYKSHPRNTDGVITRQFADESVIERAAKSVGLRCELIDLAQLTFAEQVRAVADASIVLGVHGAGLALAFLQAPGSTLIELRIAGGYSHFENIAQQSGVRYIGVTQRHGHASHGSRHVHVSESQLRAALFAASRHAPFEH